MEKAITVLDYAIAQHPYSPWFLIKKSGLLIYFKKYKLALALLDQAETLDPSDIGIHILRSDIYMERKEHGKAVSILELAMQVCDDSDKEELHLEMADVYEDWDRYELVFESLKKYLRLIKKMKKR